VVFASVRFDSCIVDCWCYHLGLNLSVWSSLSVITALFHKVNTNLGIVDDFQLVSF
jgi:hypothetical protein